MEKGRIIYIIPCIKVQSNDSKQDPNSASCLMLVMAKPVFHSIVNQIAHSCTQSPVIFFCCEFTLFKAAVI